MAKVSEDLDPVPEVVMVFVLIIDKFFDPSRVQLLAKRTVPFLFCI
jgi:hypothetical protein